MEEDFIEKTKSWIKNFVLKLDLCPFAKEPFRNQRIKYVINNEINPIPIFNSILVTAQELISSHDFDTAFVITPGLNISFEQYFDMSNEMEKMLNRKIHDAVKLIAFHPDFIYQNEPKESIQNSTNRSPYPMIHLLVKDDLKSHTVQSMSKSIIRKNRETLSKFEDRLRK